MAVILVNDHQGPSRIDDKDDQTVPFLFFFLEISEFYHYTFD